MPARPSRLGLTYLDLGEFASHLVALFQLKRRNEFPAVFAMIERLHTEGNSYVQEAATIGLLEAIQNVAGNAEIAPEVFRPFVLPESLRWWDKLNRCWSGDVLALRDFS